MKCKGKHGKYLLTTRHPSKSEALESTHHFGRFGAGENPGGREHRHMFLPSCVQKKGWLFKSACYPSWEISPQISPYKN